MCRACSCEVFVATGEKAGDETENSSASKKRPIYCKLVVPPDELVVHNKKKVIELPTPVKKW